MYAARMSKAASLSTSSGGRSWIQTPRRRRPRSSSSDQAHRTPLSARRNSWPGGSASVRVRCPVQGIAIPPAPRRGGAFMGLGNPMGQLGAVLVSEDKRLLTLDDQNDGHGRLPALEQIRLRTVVTPRHQPRRPRRLRGGQDAGPARPENLFTGIDLTGEHEEQSTGDSLDAPGAHRPILVSDEQRHVRHVCRPVFEAIVAALGFHDQERVHRSQSQTPLPRHGLPPAYRPRFTLACGGERGLQVCGIGLQALVGLGPPRQARPGDERRL